MKRSTIAGITAAILAVAIIGCSIRIPPVPPIPVPVPATTTTTVTTTTTTSSTTTTTMAPQPGPGPTPLPVAYGPECSTPGQDLKTDDNRWGDYVPVSFLSINPDQLLGDWAEKHLQESKNADGSYTLTADQVFTGPSGKVQVFKYWREATSSAPQQYTNSITTKDRDNVSRAYFSAHEPK